MGAGLLTVVALLGLVLIHEAGHFIAAKAVGLRATRFYVGFPPAIAKRRVGDTEYGIGAIPLGGFVKVVGMARPRPRDLTTVRETILRIGAERPEGVPADLSAAMGRVDRILDTDELRDIGPAVEELAAALERERFAIDDERWSWCEAELRRVREDVDPGAYWRAAIWRRQVFVAAGPFANLLAAVVILTAFFWHGVPNYQPTNRVQAVQAERPAAAIGLHANDRIVRIGGAEVKSFDDVRRLLQQTGSITVTVERNGRELTLGPTRTVVDGDRRVLGFQPGIDRMGTLSYGPAGALEAAGDDMWFVTTATFKALGEVVTGQNRDQLGTPVGIVDQAGETTRAGVWPRLIALISLSLAIFNLLPFLPLDGGHLLFNAIEWVRRRPVRREIYERVSVIGIAAMLMLFAVGLSNDIGRITNGPSP